MGLARARAYERGWLRSRVTRRGHPSVGRVALVELVLGGLVEDVVEGLAHGLAGREPHACGLLELRGVRIGQPVTLGLLPFQGLVPGVPDALEDLHLGPPVWSASSHGCSSGG